MYIVFIMVGFMSSERWAMFEGTTRFHRWGYRCFMNLKRNAMIKRNGKFAINAYKLRLKLKIFNALVGWMERDPNYIQLDENLFQNESEILANIVRKNRLAKMNRRRNANIDIEQVFGRHFETDLYTLIQVDEPTGREVIPVEVEVMVPVIEATKPILHIETNLDELKSNSARRRKSTRNNSTQISNQVLLSNGFIMTDTNESTKSHNKLWNETPTSNSNSNLSRKTSNLDMFHRQSFIQNHTGRSASIKSSARSNTSDKSQSERSQSEKSHSETSDNETDYNDNIKTLRTIGSNNALLTSGRRNSNTESQSSNRRLTKRKGTINARQLQLQQTLEMTNNQPRSTVKLTQANINALVNRLNLPAIKARDIRKTNILNYVREKEEKERSRFVSYSFH